MKNGRGGLSLVNESVKKIVEHHLARVKREGEYVLENKKMLEEEMKRNNEEMAKIIKEKHELEDFLSKN